MLRVKLSPSILDEFNNFLCGNYELWNKTEADLKNYLLGVRTPNTAMSLGNVVHRMIEEGPEKFENEPGFYSVRDEEMKADWLFTDDALSPIRTLNYIFPDASHEVWNELTIKIPGAEILLKMRHDFLEGIRLHEVKTTTGQAKKYADYLKSLQWRCYLLALPECPSVTYHCLRFPNAEPDRIIAACNYSELTYRQYDGMENDVREIATEFMEWAKQTPAVMQKITI